MNIISLIGRLTRDPELEQTGTGTPVCRMRLAVPRRRKEGRDQGAVFVNMVVYGPKAVAAADFLSKGRQVGVSGRLEHREWTDPDGAHRSVHEVVADHVQFLGGQPNGLDTEPAPDAQATPALNGGPERWR